MIKRLFILLLFLGTYSSVFSRHITGGEIYYEYLGSSTPGKSDYRITLRLFRDFFSTGAQLDLNANIAIYEKGTSSQVVGSPFIVNLDHIDVLERSANLPCIINPPQVKYQVGYYYFNISLPDIPSGYWISFQRCCRVDNIANLGIAVGVGATYLGSIAGTNDLGLGKHNSSPRFNLRDTAMICRNRNFVLDFGAFDPDGDVLTYQFCDAYDGASSGSPVVSNPAPPPYSPVPYGNGFSSSFPLGNSVSIDPNTGIISGIAPGVGQYTIAVCVSEWRSGVIINQHRKDFILKIADCDFVAAQLPLKASFCDDFTVSFANQTPSSLIHTWQWDFGVPGATSTQEFPKYTYADTGVYNVKLVVNPGEQCTDSAEMQLGVFPGFFPDFSFAGICVNKPTQFSDATTTTYGTVNGWQWNFGVPGTIADTSRLQNPVYTYSTISINSVRLIVQSSKGCIDTAYKDISIIDKPPINFPFRDTLICSIDTLQLQAMGSGNFSWAPNYNIINPNSPTPLVYPKNTTWYTTTLDDNGCVNKDSVRVRVVDFVTLAVKPDTTSCAGDPVQLIANTDGLYFSWSPAATLNDPALQNPVASPTATTNYQLVASIGKCSATDNLTVKVVPYPFVDAGADTLICYRTTAQLSGQITGSSFSWAPKTTLDNPNLLNPIASPTRTTAYILTAYDTIGCPKPGYDTVIVTVLPKVNAFAGNDTAIVLGQPLQLNASGGVGYLWSPPTGLNNVTIHDPIAILSLNEVGDSIRYWVTVTDQAGCIDSATMQVKLFKTNPQVFVPTAFTPNGDGRNDVLRPIAVGIERIEYFRIYNRWGQLVFSTTTNGRGWDGKIGGKLQGTNTFVWLVKAVDYTGKPYFSKGTATLIR